MKYLEKHPMIMIVIGILGISMSAVLVRYSNAPSIITATYRLVWTVVLMAPVALGKKEYRKELFQSSPKLLWLCFFSGVFLALHFVTWFESLKHTSVASSTTIVCTEVVWVALGYAVILKGKLSMKAIVAMAIALIGSVIIALSDYSAGGNHFYGDFLALFAAVTVAGYTLIGRVVRTDMDISTTTYTYLVYLSCAVTLVVTAVFTGVPLTGYGSSAVVVGLLLSLFSTILGHSIFSWCLKFLSPAFVSASKLCEPVIAALLAVCLFSEIPGILQIIGGAIILLGVLLYSKVEAKNQEDLDALQE